MGDAVLALDQGTTSSRAIVFDAQAAVVSMAQREFPQIYPGDAQVEHDPADHWGSTMIQRESAHVDVVGRLLAARKHEVAVEHGLGRDEVDQRPAVGFELGRGGCGHGFEFRCAP